MPACSLGNRWDNCLLWVQESFLSVPNPFSRPLIPVVRQCHVLRWGLSSWSNIWKAGWRFTRVTFLKNMADGLGRRWNRGAVVCSSPHLEPASIFTHAPPLPYWEAMGVRWTALVVEPDCLRFFRFLAFLGFLILSSSCPCHILCLKNAPESLHCSSVTSIWLMTDLSETAREARNEPGGSWSGWSSWPWASWAHCQTLSDCICFL